MLENFFNLQTQKITVNSDLNQQLLSQLSNSIKSVKKNIQLSKKFCNPKISLFADMSEEIHKLKFELNIDKADYIKKIDNIRDAKDQIQLLKQSLLNSNNLIASVNSLEQFLTEYRKPNLSYNHQKISYFAAEKENSQSELKNYRKRKNENEIIALQLAENINNLKLYIKAEKMFTNMYEELDTRRYTIQVSKEEEFQTRSQVSMKTVKSTGPEYIRFERPKNYLNTVEPEKREGNIQCLYPLLKELPNFNMPTSDRATQGSEMLLKEKAKSHENLLFSRNRSPTCQADLEKNIQAELNRKNLERLNMIEKNTKYQIKQDVKNPSSGIFSPKYLNMKSPPRNLQSSLNEENPTEHKEAIKVNNKEYYDYSSNLTQIEDKMSSKYEKIMNSSSKAQTYLNKNNKKY